MTQSIPTIGIFCAFIYSEQTLNIIYPIVLVTEYIISLFLLVFVFFKIRKSLGRLNKLLSKSLEGNVSMERHQEMMERRQKTVWILFLITVAFFVMWTPHQLMYFIFQCTQAEGIHWNSKIFQAGVLLGFSNPCINPFLYAFQSREFRSRGKELFVDYYRCCEILLLGCSTNDEEHESELRNRLLVPA